MVLGHQTLTAHKHVTLNAFDGVRSLDIDCTQRRHTECQIMVLRMSPPIAYTSSRHAECHRIVLHHHTLSTHLRVTLTAVKCCHVTLNVIRWHYIITVYCSHMRYIDFY